MPSMLSEASRRERWPDSCRSRREKIGLGPRRKFRSPRPSRRDTRGAPEKRIGDEAPRKSLMVSPVCLDASVEADLPGFPVHESSIGMLNYFA